MSAAVAQAISTFRVSIVSCGRRLAMGMVNVVLEDDTRSAHPTWRVDTGGQPPSGLANRVQATLSGSRLQKIEEWAWGQCASENRIRLLVFGVCVCKINSGYRVVDQHTALAVRQNTLQVNNHRIESAVQY